MTDAWWSSCRGEICIRIRGLGPRRAIQVRPGTAAGRFGLPSMAGQVVLDGTDACFIPGFPFVDGTGYVVEVEGQTITRLVRPRPVPTRTGRVIAIRPSALEVPRNLLRIYVWFSAPMSEGVSADHVRLLDEDGATMDGSIMPSEYELWDAQRRRLTLLLDPARIKRGLAPQREIGYPLQHGRLFTVAVGSDFPDARGVPMVEGAEQTYRVVSDERRRIDPETWGIFPPCAGSMDPLRVAFDRPLDHGLLLRCLRVSDPDGQSVRGTIAIAREERAWVLTPSGSWKRGGHQLTVDPVLEDVAGNSVSRAFDQERCAPVAPSVAGPVRLRFEVGRPAAR